MIEPPYLPFSLLRWHPLLNSSTIMSISSSIQQSSRANHDDSCITRVGGRRFSPRWRVAASALLMLCGTAAAQRDMPRRDLAFPPQPPEAQAAAKDGVAGKPVADAKEQARALFEHIVDGNMVALEELTKQGVHLAARNEDGEPPLFVAAERGSSEVLALFIRELTDLRLRTRNGETAMHAAAMRGDPVIIRQLLDAGAEPNSLNMNGETPLAWAAMTGNPKAANTLLERGAIVNAADENGNTPLHGAAAAGHADVVNVLLSRRANTALRNRDGRTARELAVEREQTDVVRLLPP